MTVLYIGIGTVALPDDVVCYPFPVVYYPIPVKFIPPCAGFFLSAHAWQSNAIFLNNTVSFIWYSAAARLIRLNARGAPSAPLCNEWRISMAKTVVVFHSGYGHTERLAKVVAEGAGAELIAIDQNGDISDEAWQTLDEIGRAHV